jgi:hypothetical protein
VAGEAARQAVQLSSDHWLDSSVTAIAGRFAKFPCHAHASYLLEQLTVVHRFRACQRGVDAQRSPPVAEVATRGAQVTVSTKGRPTPLSQVIPVRARCDHSSKEDHSRKEAGESRSQRAKPHEQKIRLEPPPVSDALWSIVEEGKAGLVDQQRPFLWLLHGTFRLPRLALLLLPGGMVCLHKVSAVMLGLQLLC